MDLNIDKNTDFKLKGKCVIEESPDGNDYYHGASVTVLFGKANVIIGTGADLTECYLDIAKHLQPRLMSKTLKSKFKTMPRTKTDLKKFVKYAVTKAKLKGFYA